jgi:hypothetical protein
MVGMEGLTAEQGFEILASSYSTIAGRIGDLPVEGPKSFGI